jgi:hypothetical protein
LDETLEEWMRLIRLALKFRVILATDEVGMIAELNQFGQCPIR